MQFTKAIEAAPGGIVRSTERNRLARAFNDRILSGVGDAPWRIVWETVGLVQQIRNPSTAAANFAIAANWPSADEWFKYALIKPSDGLDWPASDPGEPEGLNLANPLANFVYGVNWVPEEGDRLATVVPVGSSGTPLDFWEGAKAQRGAVDVRAGFGASPTLDASRAHYKVAYPWVSHYLKTYGGFQPTRKLDDGDCGDDLDAPTLTEEIIFTPLAPNPRGLPVKRYSGFCPKGSPGATSALATIGYGTDYYYLYKWAGENLQLIEALRTDEYLEGPYTGGGRIRWGKGEQIDHALNRFNVSFRGADSERLGRFSIADIGFDFQSFFRDQYLLAPARGTYSAATGQITADYPEFRLEGASSFPAGTRAPRTGSSSQSHDIHEGHVLAGCFAQAEKLTAPVAVELVDQTGVLAMFELKPDAQQNASHLKYLSGAFIRRRAGVGFRLRTGLSLGAGGKVIFQIAELMDYKPSLTDAYVVIRLGSTRGGDVFGQTNSLDTFGEQAPGVARALSDDYFARGCIVNDSPGLPLQNGTPARPIGRNPVYEAARLLNISNVRLAWSHEGTGLGARPLLRGYEVIIEDGAEKSVLYYNRFVAIEDFSADVWEGIGPALAPVTLLKPGLLYEVTDGAIGYFQTNGTPVTIPAGSIFYGVIGKKEFTVVSGDPVVREKEGIRASAPPDGESNRWCGFFSLNVYHPSESSVWKEEIYHNTLTLNQRCNFYSTELEERRYADLRRHFAYGLNPLVWSEAAPGHIYARGTNKPPTTFFDEQKEAFYRSCPIYQAPYEIESVTRFTGEGDEQVRVKLKTRLAHVHALSGPVPKTVETWDVDAVENEPYRTDENAVRQFLIRQQLGINCARGMLGDAAARTDLWGLPDEPFGSCLPRFWMVRLIPEVYEDQNDTMEEDRDSLVLVDALLQMEKYGRAMCEGYVDTNSTETLACQLAEDETTLLDYTVENWYFDAFGAKWIPILPFKIRGDLERGFSPMPTHVLYAEIFNCFVKAVNLLTRARIELPMKLECREISSTGSAPITPHWPESPGCSSGLTKAIWTGGAPPASSTTVGEWGDCGFSLNAGHSVSIDDECHPSGGFQTLGSKTVVEYRSGPVDPLAVHAIPSALREHLQQNGTGFLAVSVHTTHRPVATQVFTSGETQGCCFQFQEPCPGFFGAVEGAGWRGYKFADQVTTAGPVCKLYSGGTLDAGTPPSGDLFFGRSASGAQCSNSSSVNLALAVAGSNFSVFVEIPLA